VQCILSASSHAFSLPETHFFSWVMPALGVRAEDVIDIDQVRRARRELEAEAELVLPGQFWAELEGRGDTTVLGLFVAIVEHFRIAPGLRAIEKTPRHVLHLDTIGQAFPDAVFVNVVRDPIDVASSLLGVPFESSRSMLSYAQRWLESIQVARAFARTSPRRIQTIVYEQLVREPETQVRELCGFVELEYEPRMLQEFGREAARNVNRDEAWKRDIVRGVIVDRKGVWRGRLTPGQAWLVAQATRVPRREYGYLDWPNAPVSSIAAAMVREAGVRFQEARHVTGVVGAARHAGSVLKTLAAA
jgi:hypothetical protein